LLSMSGFPEEYLRRGSGCQRDELKARHDGNQRL